MPRIDTLLLLALPASGKSELRRYLASLDDEVAAHDFGLGPRVDLDDYPYVHLMRRIDQELRSLELEPFFFEADDAPLRDGRDWATLTGLLNEDYAALGSIVRRPDRPTQWLLGRLDAARRTAGIDAAASMQVHAEHLADRLDDEVALHAQQRAEALAAYQPSRSTVVVEFARGGPLGSAPPLSPPHGYAYSLAALAPLLLRRAVVLYVWVTPEESRRRNRDRAVPGPDGDASILHHGVPERVMREDYGSDDFLWLLDEGGGSAIEVETGAGRLTVPAAVFDNRVDRTSFLRADPAEWDAAAVIGLHDRLVEAFASFT